MKHKSMMIVILAMLLLSTVGCKTVNPPNTTPEPTLQPSVTEPTLRPSVAEPEPTLRPSGSGLPEKEEPTPTPAPAIARKNYTWHIIGTGEQPFETPGIKGTNKMIVSLDLTKQDGETPAGTYMGSLSLWYHEMTPELMKEYGITGDSYNEYKTDSFTVELAFSAGNAEWSFQSAQAEQQIVITSITNVTVNGIKQQTTDSPSVSFALSFDMNPDIGKARLTMTLGKLEPLVFEDLQIERIDYTGNPFPMPTLTPTLGS